MIHTNENYSKEGIVWSRNCLLVQSSEFKTIGNKPNQPEAELFIYDLGPNKLDSRMKEIYNNKDYANENGELKSIQELIQGNIFNMKFETGGSSAITTISQWRNGSEITNSRNSQSANASVGIFDEFTNFLDSDNEKKIMNEISNLKDQTRIIVSHKNSTLNFCNKLFEIKDNTLIKKL